MNELLEQIGSERASVHEPVLLQEGQRETLEAESLLNQSQAAAESLRRRFLEADNKFYFRVGPGEAATVAFFDHRNA